MSLVERLVDWGIRKGIQVFTPLGYFVADEKEKWMAFFGWYIANTFFFGFFLYQHPDYVSYIIAMSQGVSSYLAYVLDPNPILVIDIIAILKSYGFFIIGFVLTPFFFLTHHPKVKKWFLKQKISKKVSIRFLRDLRFVLTIVGISYCVILFAYQITSIDYQAIFFYRKGFAYLIPVVLFMMIYWTKRERSDYKRKMTGMLIFKLWFIRILLLAFFAVLILFYITLFFASGTPEQIITGVPLLQ